MGFLSDFRAAGREPDPPPPGADPGPVDPARPASRFDYAPAEPGIFGEHGEYESTPLPVWPPVPAPAAPSADPAPPAYTPMTETPAPDGNAPSARRRFRRG